MYLLRQSFTVKPSLSSDVTNFVRKLYSSYTGVENVQRVFVKPTLKRNIYNNPLDLSVDKVMSTPVPVPLNDMISKLHPLSIRAIQESWIELENYPILSRAGNPKYSDYGTIWLAAAYYPEVPYDILKYGIKFLHWAWIADDIIENPPDPGCNDAYAQQALIYAMTKGFQTGSTTHDFAKLTVDIHQAMLADKERCLPWVAKLFNDTVLEWLCSELEMHSLLTKINVEPGKRENYPTMDEYMAIRVRTVGMNQTQVFGIWGTTNKMLAEEEWYHPLLVKLRHHFNVAFFADNDLHSFSREYREKGGLLNMPGILMVQDGISLEDAYKETLDQVHKASADFLDQSKEIRASSAFYHPGIEKTLRFMEHIFGGNQNIFNYLTKRYTLSEDCWHMPDTNRISLYN